MTTTCGVAVVVRGLMKKPIIRRNHKRSTNNKLIRVVSEPSWSQSYYEEKEELLFENNKNKNQTYLERVLLLIVFSGSRNDDFETVMGVRKEVFVRAKYGIV